MKKSNIQTSCNTLALHLEQLKDRVQKRIWLALSEVESRTPRLNYANAKKAANDLINQIIGGFCN